MPFSSSSSPPKPLSKPPLAKSPEAGILGSGPPLVQIPNSGPDMDSPQPSSLIHSLHNPFNLLDLCSMQDHFRSSPTGVSEPKASSPIQVPQSLVGSPLPLAPDLQPPLPPAPPAPPLSNTQSPSPALGITPSPVPHVRALSQPNLPPLDFSPQVTPAVNSLSIVLPICNLEPSYA